MQFSHIWDIVLINKLESCGQIKKHIMRKLSSILLIIAYEICIVNLQRLPFL